MSEWCEHIKEGDIFGSTWKYCPFCARPKPEEPKKLWEKMKIVYWRFYPNDEPRAQECAEDSARIAIEEVVKVVDKMGGNKRLHSHDANKIKEEIMKLL